MPHDDRQAGIKKSQFVQQSTIPAGATFDFVINGTNIKITKEDLLAALGVTGTIVTAGAATATDVLQTVGSVNRIRGIEDGPGILSSLSPENGIKLQHNFVQDTIGFPLLVNPTDATPAFISVLPGSGIAITQVNNVMTITATGVALPSTLTVTINQLADFPTAVAGVITLVADTTYILSNDVSTSNRFVFSNNTSLISHSVRSPLLTYTGSATMLTGVDVSVRLREVRLNCPSAKLFDFSDTVGGTKTVTFSAVTCISCDTVGDIGNLLAFVAAALTVLSVTTTGIVFTGSNFTTIEFVSATFTSANAGFIGLDLGTSIAEKIDILANSFSGPSGAIGIKGAAADANFTANGFGVLADNRFTGGITTPLSGIVINTDLKWVSSNNQDIPDTKPDSLSTNTASTAIAIAGAGAPVKIAGTWVDQGSAMFTPDLAGRVTYNGERDFSTPIDVSVSVSPDSGSNKDFTVFVAINGTVVTASGVQSTASSGDKPSVGVIWQHTFQTNDFVETFLANDTDTVDFTMTHGVLRIN